jgi:hypothetical protein
MIITRLWGGLGNQMFQYAAGRALALRNAVPLQVDIYDLVDRTPREDFVHRDCDLGLLMAPLDFASLADLGRASEKPNRLRTRLRLRYRKECLAKSTFLEKDQQFSPDLLKSRRKNAYLVGYWHDERYFHDFEGHVRRDFAIRGSYQSEFQSRILDSNSVCLNVRRADFVSIKSERESRVQCGKNYYREALEKLIGLEKGVTVFGFSDDIEWCEENLKLQVPITWVPHSEAGFKFGCYFWLMRQCRHFIIPNSTFAWWAAWLAEHPEKRVICPREWYCNRYQMSEGFLPDCWIKVDVDESRC